MVQARDGARPKEVCTDAGTYCRNVASNAKVGRVLEDCIEEAQVIEGCEKTVGNLLYYMATKFPTNANRHRKVLAQYVAQGKIKVRGIANAWKTADGTPC